MPVHAAAATISQAASPAYSHLSAIWCWSRAVPGIVHQASAIWCCVVVHPGVVIPIRHLGADRGIIFIPMSTCAPGFATVSSSGIKR